MQTFIEGTWGWSGPWLMFDSAIAKEQDLPDIAFEEAPFCPCCLSDGTIRLSTEHQEFPYSFYCRNCGLVWLPCSVKCPECSRILYNLHCDKCDYDWDEELIKQMYNEGW